MVIHIEQYNDEILSDDLVHEYQNRIIPKQKKITCLGNQACLTSTPFPFLD